MTTDDHIEARLVRELCDRSGAGVEPRHVRRTVVQALRELRGSVTPESLPEMASRLAAVRLESAAAHCR